jgi:hypothetical protein
MKKASSSFGITVGEPYWIEVENPRDFRDWKDVL